MPNARPTPEWSDVYAEDAGDLLHDLDVLERRYDEALAEAENLRNTLDDLEAQVQALREENAALRRVAEAAEAALELLRDPRTRRIDAIAPLERFVADWRRVRGE